MIAMVITHGNDGNHNAAMVVLIAMILIFMIVLLDGVE